MVKRFDRNDTQLPSVEDFAQAGMSVSQNFEGTTEQLLRSLSQSLWSESYENDIEIMFQVLRSKGIQWDTTKYLLTDLSIYTPPRTLVV